MLAVAAPTRIAALPDVPTFDEAGLPGYEVTNWFGVLAPAATPREIVAKLNTLLISAGEAAETKERLAAQGVDVALSTPDNFAAFLKGEYGRWGKVIRAANIKLD